MAMDWSEGFMVKFYATEFDPVRWRDLDRFEISGGSIQNTDSGIRSSATLDLTEFDNSIEHWVRVWMEAKQDSSAWRGAIFTGITDVTDTSIDGGLTSQSVPCNSVLRAAEDVYLPLGWFASAGANGAGVVKELLSVIGAPIIVKEGSPILDQYIVADISDNHLSMAEKILTAIGWTIRLHGDGTIEIGPEINFGSDQIASIFDAQTNDVIQLKVTLSNSHANVPNVFRAVSDDQVAVSRDDDPTSKFSTVSRGREIWKQDTGVVLSANESLSEYASRRLQEEQTVSTVVSYDRSFDPDILVGDHILIRYPKQGIYGEFEVSSQTISLGGGASTSEESFSI